MTTPDARSENREDVERQRKERAQLLDEDVVRVKFIKPEPLPLGARKEIAFDAGSVKLHDVSTLSLLEVRDRMYNNKVIGQYFQKDFSELPNNTLEKKLKGCRVVVGQRASSTRILPGGSQTFQMLRHTAKPSPDNLFELSPHLSSFTRDILDKLTDPKDHGYAWIRYDPRMTSRTHGSGGHLFEADRPRKTTETVDTWVGLRERPFMPREAVGRIPSYPNPDTTASNPDDLVSDVPDTWSPRELNPIPGSYVEADSITLNADDEQSNGYYMCFLWISFEAVTALRKGAKDGIYDPDVTKYLGEAFAEASAWEDPKNPRRRILLPCYLLYFMIWQSYVELSVRNAKETPTFDALAEHVQTLHNQLNRLIPSPVIADRIAHLTHHSKVKWYKRDAGYVYGNCNVLFRPVNVADEQVSVESPVTTYALVVGVDRVSGTTGPKQKSGEVTVALVAVIVLYNTDMIRSASPSWEPVAQTYDDLYTLDDDIIRHHAFLLDAETSILSGSFEWYKGLMPSMSNFLGTQQTAPEFVFTMVRNPSPREAFTLWQVKPEPSVRTSPGPEANTTTAAYLFEEQCTNEGQMRLFLVDFLSRQTPTLIYSTTPLARVIVNTEKMDTRPDSNPTLVLNHGVLSNVERLVWTCWLKFRQLARTKDNWRLFWKNVITPASIRENILARIPHNVPFPSLTLDTASWIVPFPKKHIFPTGRHKKRYAKLTIMELVAYLVSHLRTYFLFQQVLTNPLDRIHFTNANVDDPTTPVYAYIKRLLNIDLSTPFSSLDVITQQTIIMVAIGVYVLQRDHQWDGEDIVLDTSSSDEDKEMVNSYDSVAYNNASLDEFLTNGSELLDIIQSQTGGKASYKIKGKSGRFVSGQSLKIAYDSDEDRKMIGEDASEVLYLWIERILREKPKYAGIFEYWLSLQEDNSDGVVTKAFFVVKQKDIQIPIWRLLTSDYQTKKNSEGMPIALSSEAGLLADIDVHLMQGQFLASFLTLCNAIDRTIWWIPYRNLLRQRNILTRQQYVYAPTSAASTPPTLPWTQIGGRYTEVAFGARPKLKVKFRHIMKLLVPDWRARVDVTLLGKHPPMRMTVSVVNELTDIATGRVFVKPFEPPSDRQLVWVEKDNLYLPEEAVGATNLRVRLGQINALALELRQKGSTYPLIEVCEHWARESAASVFKDETEGGNVFHTIKRQLEAVGIHIARGIALDGYDCERLALEVGKNLLDADKMDLFNKHFLVKRLVPDKVDFTKIERTVGAQYGRASYLFDKLVREKRFSAEDDFRIDDKCRFFLEHIVAPHYVESGTYHDVSADILVRWLWQICLFNLEHNLGTAASAAIVRSFVLHPGECSYRQFTTKAVAWEWFGIHRQRVSLVDSHVVESPKDGSQSRELVSVKSQMTEIYADYYTLTLPTLPSIWVDDLETPTIPFVQCHGKKISSYFKLINTFLRFLQQELRLITWYDITGSTFNTINIHLMVSDDFMLLRKGSTKKDLRWPLSLKDNLSPRCDIYRWFCWINSKQEFLWRFLIRLASLDELQSLNLTALARKYGVDINLLSTTYLSGAAGRLDYSLVKLQDNNRFQDDYHTFNKLLGNKHGASDLSLLLTGHLLDGAPFTIRRTQPKRTCSTFYSELANNRALTYAERQPFREIVKQRSHEVISTIKRYISHKMSKLEQEEITSIRFVFGAILDDVLALTQWSYRDVVKLARKHYEPRITNDPLLDQVVEHYAKRLDQLFNVKLKAISRSLWFDYYKLSREGTLCSAV